MGRKYCCQVMGLLMELEKSVTGAPRKSYVCFNEMPRLVGKAMALSNTECGEGLPCYGRISCNF
jgi:hypothetical protein